MEALKQSLHTYAESLRGQHATRIEIATELDRLAASIADADSRPAAQPGVVKGLTIDDVERIIIETEPVSMSDKGDRIWTRRMAVALAEKLAASPAPSLPEDVERVVERFEITPGPDLGVIHRQHPHGYYVRWTDYAELERQLAEARAEIAEKSGSWVLSRCVEAEADRDRLAAENERLREICRMLRDSYEPRTGTYALGELHQARESARAALASLEERT